jgi:hypothetical protein
VSPAFGIKPCRMLKIFKSFSEDFEVSIFRINKSEKGFGHLWP